MLQIVISIDFQSVLQHYRGTKMCKEIYKNTPPGLELSTPRILVLCSAIELLPLCLKERPVLGIKKERRGFTELLRNCPEYSGDFLNIKEISLLNFLRRIP
jgi:hypothetical protein